MGTKRLAGTKRLVAAAAVAMGLGVGVVAQAGPAFADSYSPSAAAQFVSAINALRASHGLGALAVNNSLVSMADNWAVRLAGAGSLSHNPGLASEAPSGWRLLGENVGVGPGVSALQQAFTASPEHYANMVNPAFSQIGVGVYVSSQGYLWVTEDYMEPPAVAPAAAPVAPVRPAPAPATVSVRPVSLTVPAAGTPTPVAPAVPATAAPAVPATAAPAAHPVVTAKPAPTPPTPAAPAPVASPAPPAPLGPLSSVRAKLGLMPAQDASLAVPAPAHHASPVGGLGQLIPAAASFAAHAQAPALLLIPLAGMAWLLPRRRPGYAARGRISTV